MQDSALEDLYGDLRYQIYSGSEEQLAQLRMAFDRDLPEEVFERGQCFGCLVQGVIPEGVNLSTTNVYEMMAHGHCHRHLREIPEQITNNGQASGVQPTLEQLKADILNHVEAKLDTLRPYFNQQSTDPNQPGPSGLAAVSSSNPATDTAKSAASAKVTEDAKVTATGTAKATASADSSDSLLPAQGCTTTLDLGKFNIRDYDQLITQGELEEECSSLTGSDSD